MFLETSSRAAQKLGGGQETYGNWHGGMGNWTGHGAAEVCRVGQARQKAWRNLTTQLPPYHCTTSQTIASETRIPKSLGSESSLPAVLSSTRLDNLGSLCFCTRYCGTVLLCYLITEY